MTIQRLEEHQIDAGLHQQIGALLGQCFPDYPAGRSFFNQLSSFRYLVWDDGRLVAHMGVDHRIINNEGQLLRIFGIADLCVLQSYQHQKLATGLLEQLEKLARKAAVDFLVLVAKDHALYRANGFQVVDNTCCWLMIHQNTTLGIAQRRLEKSLLVKRLGQKEWKRGPVDFLGPVF